MDKAKTTPKDFFLWAGAMVSLYWSVIAFLFLMFNYIDYAFPSSLSPYPLDPYQSGVPYEMASLIVLFPVFLLLMWLIERDVKRDASRKEVWVRRWALVLTLFIAGVTMAGDLINILTKFLGGQSLTESFVLEAALIFLVAAAGAMHFGAGLWGYWEQYPARQRSVAYAVTVLVLGTLASGFIMFGTPAQAREFLLDAQRVDDLQTIQSQVVMYWQDNGKLPATLADLSDSISGFTAPVDEQTGKPYTYQVTGAASFNVCATFSQAGQGAVGYAPQAYPTTPASMEAVNEQDNWQHGAGQVCFPRTIDPARYPPVKAAQ